MELVAQGDIDQFRKETKMFHFEFTGMCNQHCSYCLEGNFDPQKEKVLPSKKEDLYSILDKIFDAYPEDVALCFILVGGEATLQPHFIDVVNRIKSRKNAFQLVTTNFTQSVDYYRELNIPLVTSLHLDSHEPKEWLEKTLALKDLVVHTRIMAHPKKMDKVKEAYNLFIEASKTNALSFAVEEIMDFQYSTTGKELNYRANYAPEDLEYVRNCKIYDAPYPKSLDEKMGTMKNFFYRGQWFYRGNEGDEKVRINDFESNNLKGFFCERSMVIIRPKGDLVFGWGCYDPCYNLLKEEKFPKEKLTTVVCSSEKCPFSMGSSIPKYKYVEYAPVYVSKEGLEKLQMQLTGN